MCNIGTLPHMGLVLGFLSFSAAAHAQQQSAPTAKQPIGLSSKDIQLIIDHERQGMMTECLQLRQNMGPGVNMNPETQKMLARCDQLEQETKR